MLQCSWAPLDSTGPSSLLRIITIIITVRSLSLSLSLFLSSILFDSIDSWEGEIYLLLLIPFNSAACYLHVCALPSPDPVPTRRICAQQQLRISQSTFLLLTQSARRMSHPKTFFFFLFLLRLRKSNWAESSRAELRDCSSATAPLENCQHYFVLKRAHIQHSPMQSASRATYWRRSPPFRINDQSIKVKLLLNLIVASFFLSPTDWLTWRTRCIWSEARRSNFKSFLFF